MAKFNKKRAMSDNLPDMVAEGLHALVITTTPEVNPKENGDLQLPLVITVLKDIEDPNSLVSGAELRQWPNLPLDNEEVPDHTYPKWAMSKWQPLAAALYPDEVPRRPYKTRGGKGQPYNFQGEEIDNKQINTFKNEADVAAGEKAEELFENGGFSSMVGTPFWGLVKHQEGSTFVNLYPYPADDPPTDFATGEAMDIVDPSECIVKADLGDDE